MSISGTGVAGKNDILMGNGGSEIKIDSDTLSGAGYFYLIGYGAGWYPTTTDSGKSVLTTNLGSYSKFKVISLDASKSYTVKSDGKVWLNP